MVTMDLGLFHLMEDFILKEVDYSQEYGYSSRAKRFMKRKLNKKLTPYLEKQYCKCKRESSNSSDSDSVCDIDVSNYSSDSDDSKNERTFMCQHKWFDFCYGFTYACVVGTFYGSIMYIVFSYNNYKS